MFLTWGMPNKDISNEEVKADRSLVKWIPLEGWVKLKFGRASKGNPRDSGAWGIIRSHQGTILVSCVENMGH